MDQIHYHEFEVILIENGSTDNSIEICELLSKTYKNIIFIKNSEVGVSLARNKGLDLSTGDIIGFCDSDDYFHDNILEEIMNIFESDKSIKEIIGRYNITQDISKKYSLKIFPFFDSVVNSKDFFGSILCDKNVMGSVCNKFYRVELIKKVRFSPHLTLCEDMAFNIDVLKKNPEFKVLIKNKTIYSYTVNEKNTTRDRTKLFDLTGTLNYNKAYCYILNSYKLSCSEKNYVNIALFNLAVENFNYAQTKTETSKLLFQIKDNIKIALKNIYKYGIVKNFRHILKGYLILLFQKKYL